MRNFNDLQAEDEVFVVRNTHLKLTSVDRVTSTQIIVDGTKYRKRDGFQVGRDIWNIRHLELVTPETTKEFHRQQELKLKKKLCNNLKNYFENVPNNLSVKDLRKITEYLNKREYL